MAAKHRKRAKAGSRKKKLVTAAAITGGVFAAVEAGTQNVVEALSDPAPASAPTPMLSSTVALGATLDPLFAEAPPTVESEADVGGGVGDADMVAPEIDPGPKIRRAS